MGPRSFDRGKAVYSDARRRKTAGFNGAAIV